MSRVMLSGISKTYEKGGGRGFHDVAVTGEDGEFLVLLGPSGCGKTTLLRCLAGLEQPSAGKIEMGGSVVFDAAKSIAAPPHRRDIGMVFQNYSLWPHMTVERNVAYPLAARKVRRADQRERTRKALALVECEEL